MLFLCYLTTLVKGGRDNHSARCIQSFHIPCSPALTICSSTSDRWVADRSKDPEEGRDAIWTQEWDKCLTGLSFFPKAAGTWQIIRGHFVNGRYPGIKEVVLYHILHFVIKCNHTLSFQPQLDIDVNLWFWGCKKVGVSLRETWCCKFLKGSILCCDTKDFIP